MEGLSWIPETVKNILKNSETHYRSIGFRRVASLISSACRDVSDLGTVSPKFYSEYVRLLTDDSSQLVRSFGFPKDITEYFIASLARSIGLIGQILSELDEKGKTPTFNGTTGRTEDAEAFRKYFSAAELTDPMRISSEPPEILGSAEPFFGLVYEHRFKPGRDYLVSQLDLAVGHDRMLAVSEEILSVEKTVSRDGGVFSDFGYAQTHPGDLTEQGNGWKICEDLVVPVDRFSRWGYFMYHKVPILTAMLPVHNIVFFSLVRNNIAKRRSEGRNPSV